MAGMTTAESAATLDSRFPTSGATDYIAYSTNGTSEWSGIARTAIGATGWASATAADPSVKANNGTIVSANASEAGSPSHYAIFTASTNGTQRTDWTAFTGGAKTLAIGDNLKHEAGDISVTLT